MSNSKKVTVKWNLPEVAEAGVSPTPRSSYSYGDTTSDAYLYSESFEEPTQTQAYSDTFVSESQESYSDTFVTATNRSGLEQKSNGTGTHVSEDISAVTTLTDRDMRVSEGVDSGETYTEAVETVIEAHPSAGVDTNISETIKTAIDSHTHASEYLETVIETHMSEAVETAIDTAYDTSSQYSYGDDTFESSDKQTGTDTEYDSYSESGSYSQSYQSDFSHSDSYTHSGSPRVRSGTTSDDSQWSRPESYDQSYTESKSLDSSFIERRDRLQYSDEEYGTEEDEYSDTFEPSDMTGSQSLLYLDPEQVRQEQEMKLAAEKDSKDFAKSLISRLRRPSPEKKPESPLPQKTVTEPPDEATSRYCNKKIAHLKRKKKHRKDKEAAIKVPHPLLAGRPSLLAHYGISQSVLERAKLTRILSAMEKAAKTEVHDPNVCQECSEKNAQLDAEEATKLFVSSRAKKLQSKMMDIRVEEHLLRMNSVSLIAEMARGLPRPTERPEKILDRLFEPLLGKNMMR